MKVLVTNDDGVSSPGLHALVRALLELDHEVMVVAPNTDMSGAGASIGKLHIDQHVDSEPVKLPGLEEVPSFAVAGPPGLCVLAARLGGFGPSPDIVVSGINPGCNTGRAVLHSGTVGAALTAANFGLRGVAVSNYADAQTANGEKAQHWVTAARIGAGAVPWLIEAPDTTVLNVNVPNLPFERLAGAQWAELARFGTVRTAVVEAPIDGGRLQMEFRPTDEELPPDTDTALVQKGYVALTTLTGIQATEPIDVEPILGGVLSAAWPGTG